MRRITLALAALSLTALVAAGCSNQPASSTGDAAASPQGSASSAETPTAAPAHDAEVLPANLADAVACGHAMEIAGTAWRSDFRLANGDLDDAGYAAVELVLRDSWSTILTG